MLIGAVEPWNLAAALAIGFLAGSIPFGLLIARSKGVDIRKHGSGNIGATNVGRVLGRRYFFLCFFLDMLKGLLPVLGAGLVLGTLGRFDLTTAQSFAWLAAVLAPVLGHVFSPWLGFKGGKGVATGLGALLGLFPALTVPAALAFVVWAVSITVTRYMSLSSMIAAASIPLWVLVSFEVAGRMGRFEGSALARAWPYLLIGGLLALLVIWTHRSNIARLRAGTEPKWGRRAATEPR